jgi:hypothetical protein
MAQPRVRLVFPLAAGVLLLVFIYMYSTGAFKSWSGGSSAHASDAIAPAGANTTASTAVNGSTATAGSTSTAAGFTTPTLLKLSDDDLRSLEALSPQQQAEQLMMAAVNHYDGAPGIIMERAEGWRGKLRKTQNWDTVDQSARYSSDLRVRNADIELALVINNIDKTGEVAERLVSDATAHVGNRAFDFYMLGMLANRGVETDRIHAALRDWAHDNDEGTRYWAIEGLALIGSDDTIADFLEVLRSDPSLNVRQRCGASLAKSGMLTREQRMKAVPGLLEIAADKSQNATAQGWAFQALREITAEQIGDDAGAWQTWFTAHGSERADQFHRTDPNWVLGNS